ncbi:MAG: peptide ABC transporter substrate-binding protein, partial [Verrucomicrobiota bacterium]
MVFDGKSPGSILLATALAFASLVLSSCEQREQRVDRALRDGILLTANGSEPAELDPHIVSGDPENKVITSLLEGLIAYHPDDDYVAEPGVAESWEMEDSGRVWTFKLRKNAKWSNGDPLTAHDFHWSHMRGLSPELANEFATMLYIIEGAEAFNKGETDDFSTVGVEVIDDYTIRYRLTGPTPYFISMLKHYSFWPVHRPTIEKFGRLDERATGWTRPGNFVGNGPFILEEWKFKDHIKVRKNPHYWDADRVKLNGIHFFAVENVTTEERMFRNGQVHLTKECALNKIPFYREDYPDWIQIGPQLVTYYYLINVTRP